MEELTFDTFRLNTSLFKKELSTLEADNAEDFPLLVHPLSRIINKGNYYEFSVPFVRACSKLGKSRVAVELLVENCLNPQNLNNIRALVVRVISKPIRIKSTFAMVGRKVPLDVTVLHSHNMVTNIVVANISRTEVSLHMVMVELSLVSTTHSSGITLALLDSFIYGLKSEAE